MLLCVCVCMLCGPILLIATRVGRAYRVTHRHTRREMREKRENITYCHIYTGKLKRRERETGSKHGLLSHKEMRNRE